MVSIQDEWAEYVKGSAFKSKNTVTSYKNAHSRLTDYLEKPISKSTPADIIKAVKELATNPNTRSSLLNVAIVFYNIYQMNNAKLLKYKTDVMKEIAEHREKSLAAKEKVLPNMEFIKNHLKGLYVQERWSDFIIMWLMVEFNTRNADVDVEIVDTIHKTKRDKLRNYLVVRREDFVYIRRNYKTYKTYKEKRYVFKNQLIKRAVRYFTAQMPPDSRLFLMNHQGDRLSEGSVANYLKKILPENITESDINKIQVSEIESLADYPALLKMAERRGTNAETLIRHYHLKYATK